MKGLHICDRELVITQFLSFFFFLFFFAFSSAHAVGQSHGTRADQQWWHGLQSDEAVKTCNSPVVCSSPPGQVTLQLSELPLAWAHESPSGTEALLTSLGMRYSDEKIFYSEATKAWKLSC